MSRRLLEEPRSIGEAVGASSGVVQESPEYVRLSLAAAMTLGLARGKFYRNARLGCINVLLTYNEGCAANCAYCGLSRGRKGEYGRKSFIRVKWPTHETREVLRRTAERESQVSRLCISMITRRRAKADAAAIAQMARETTGVPISALVSPTIMQREDFQNLKGAGVDKIGIAVDAATPELFDRWRGSGAQGPHRWDDYWQKIETAMDVFGPGNVGAHFIVGLGETERQMVTALQRMRSLGGSTHLFSFFPEGESQMADWPPPPIGQYRRLQLVRFLIDNDLIGFDRIRFGKDERIVGIDMPRERLEAIIDSGEPFETSGCVGRDGRVACNRPFANSLPGPDMRNYPFRPTPDDVRRIREQLWT